MSELTFERMLAVARDRDDVLGLYLFGSRGREHMVDESSDWDVCVVLRDDAALEAFDRAYPYAHGARVEISSITIEDLRVAGVVGTPSEQARYAAAHVDVLIDKTDGEIAEIVASKEWIPAADGDNLVRDALDTYINSTYRSLRYSTRLDAVESVAPALRTIFGLSGRIRPFNKYLEWELRHHPLEGWDADELLPLLDSVTAGNPDGQRELFRGHRRRGSSRRLWRRRRFVGTGPRLVARQHRVSPIRVRELMASKGGGSVANVSPGDARQAVGRSPTPP